MKIKDYTGIEIGTILNVKSRTDNTKLIKRKVVELYICTTNYNFIHVRAGFKIGKQIVYPLMEHIENDNENVKSFEAECNKSKLHYTISERDFNSNEFQVFKGDVIKQYIYNYKGVDFTTERMFVDITLLNGKKDVWYLNGLNGILPKENRKEMEDDVIPTKTI